MLTAISSAEADETPLEFLIGHHTRGGWFVVETHGLAGGLFRSEMEAFKFLAHDFQTRAKRIEVVEESFDPFDETCVEIALRCRAGRSPACSQAALNHTASSERPTGNL